jgi:hypothetical protein
MLHINFVKELVIMNIKIIYMVGQFQVNPGRFAEEIQVNEHKFR